MMACLFMNYLLCLIICSLVLASIENESLEVNLKIWSQSIPDATGEYPCGVYKSGVVKCNETQDYLEIHACYCIYWDQDTDETVVGSCIQTCFYTRNSGSFYRIEGHFISNGTLLNKAACSPSSSYVDTHREGRFYGRCKPQYGLAAYSYQYTICVPCTDYGYKNWLQYIAVALLPLTVFYFLLVVLRVSVASSHLNGIIFALQCLVSPCMQRIFNGWIDVWCGSAFHCVHNILPNIFSIFGIVNLDFFCGVYPSFCLHPQLNVIHILFLDYIIALYPFLLIFITYILLTLYQRNCHFIKLAWKPFKYLVGCYQRQCNMQISLIETFATFILLSTTKILSLSFDLLAFTIAYDKMGTEIKKKFLYYDANIEYLGHDHLPFAVFALLIGFIFVFLPFLSLVLYPCRCFQRCLNSLGWRCQTLHIFMDTFQGSYKIEPYDLRYFSSFYLLLRFLFLITVKLTPFSFVIPTLAITMLLNALIIVIFRPYKRSSQNRLDIAFMVLIALLFVALTADILASYIETHWLTTAAVLVTLSAVLFILFLTLMFAWYAFHRILRKLFLKIKNSRSSGSLSNSFEVFERSEREIDNYPPLLSSR